MAMAVNLEGAAFLSFSQGSLAWVAGTLKTKLASFILASSPLFVDADAPSRAVGNWYVPLTMISSIITAQPGLVTVTQFSTIADYLYRMCYAAAFAEADVRISSAQGVALLAAWNTAFGT